MNSPVVLAILFTVIAVLLIRTHRQGFQFNRAGDVFLLGLFYYGFSVPLDLLLGLEPGRSGWIDLKGRESVVWIEAATLCYASCLVAFAVGRALVPSTTSSEDLKKYPIAEPGALITAAVGVGLTISGWYTLQMGLDRQAMALMGRTSETFKLFSVANMAGMAFCFVVIVTSSSRPVTMLATAFGCLHGMLTGDRSAAVIMVIVYLARHGIRWKVWQMMFGGAAGVLLFVSWKAGWSQIAQWGVGEIGFYDIALQMGEFSLSAVDASSAYVWLIEVMKEDKGEYLLGYTYTVLPMMMTFPRFLTEMPVQSLSEQYVFRYAQDVFDRGGGMGFSALAESWLNFGLFGPPLFGLAAGVLTKWLDRSPRGLFYFLMVIVLLRYFRSDFASVYKSWIVVFGGLVVIIYTILKLLGNDRSSERSYSGFAVPRMKRLP